MSERQPLVSSYEQWSTQHPVIATTVETLGVMVVRNGLRMLGDRVDKNFGNAFTADSNRASEALDHPVFYGSMMVGVMPVVEELGARMVVGKLADAQRQKGNHIAAAVIEHGSQVAFGAWHAAYVRPEAHFDPFRVSIRLKRPDEGSSLPVSQFIAGEHLMRIYKKRGFWHAVGAHALNNFVALAAGARAEITHMKTQQPQTKVTPRSLIAFARARRTAA